MEPQEGGHANNAADGDSSTATLRGVGGLGKGGGQGL